MFERMFESPGFDFMSYGLSALNPKALPAPPSDEVVELGGECKETAVTPQSKDTAELPSEPNRNHSGTAAASTARPDRIMATIAVVAAAVCDITDGPTGPSHPACGTTARTGQNTAPPKPIAAPRGKPPPA